MVRNDSQNVKISVDYIMRMVLKKVYKARYGTRLACIELRRSGLFLASVGHSGGQSELMQDSELHSLLKEPLASLSRRWVRISTSRNTHCSSLSDEPVMMTSSIPNDLIW